MGNKKTIGHLLIPKSQKNWEKVEKIGLGSFKNQGQTNALSETKLVVKNDRILTI